MVYLYRIALAYAANLQSGWQLGRVNHSGNGFD
jgi:hypothetical protein